MELYSLRGIMVMKFVIVNTHDQIIHGTIAGLIGGIALTFYGIMMKSLHLTDRIFIDYGEIIILGHQSSSFPFIGVIAHLIHASLWGIIFVFIMKLGKKKYYLIKGLGCGFVIWFISLGSATLYKIPRFDVIESRVAFVLLSGASVYGVTMSLIYRYFDKKMANDPGSLEGFK